MNKKTSNSIHPPSKDPSVGGFLEFYRKFDKHNHIGFWNFNYSSNVYSIKLY